MTDPRSHTPTDISGHGLAKVHTAYKKWLGADYDIGALNCILCAAAAEKLTGDPPWLLVVAGSGNAKTESLMPLVGAGAVVISTISGEAALLSGTSKKDRAENATGGMLYGRSRGLLVLKDFTSILSMNRDTRALVLAALREIYDGRWSRNIGTDGGQVLKWEGRLVVIGAVTTAWDSAHQVVATMGDRFVLVRLDPSADGRRAAGMQAILNVSNETAMRDELKEAVRELLSVAPAEESIQLDSDDLDELLDLADLVTRSRTAVERDLQGNPVYAHALEMPTRLAKQLVQLARGGIALGMTNEAAMTVALRCARDTMPPLRLKVLTDVAGHRASITASIVKRLQLPRKTVDRTLQELHLLGLLVLGERTVRGDVQWVYSLAPAIKADTVNSVARNVSRGQEKRQTTLNGQTPSDGKTPSPAKTAKEAP